MPMKFYIKSVSLMNVKSYSNETTVEFQKGTNAISGENGAGKSTIIEAIGYALFDSRPYTNMKSMIRHGKKSGEVRVSVRGVDGRDYLIVRSIGGNSKFYVLDEALHSKISSERKEEVLNSMRQIMGIAPLGETPRDGPAMRMTTALHGLRTHSIQFFFYVWLLLTKNPLCLRQPI
ncbi:MAG TPA: hypothetical protein EYP80_00385 [Candidatus Aenigmarchaeota archaeon]|nr:hypothetical protein [Candidatus Aenigmarchaeota archaeon]